jgi:hypothetical protein
MRIFALSKHPQTHSTRFLHVQSKRRMELAETSKHAKQNAEHSQRLGTGAFYLPTETRRTTLDHWWFHNSRFRNKLFTAKELVVESIIG